MSAFEKQLLSNTMTHVNQGVRLVIPYRPDDLHVQEIKFLIIRQGGDLLEDVVHAQQVCRDHGLEEVTLPKTPIWARVHPVIQGRLTVNKDAEFWLHGKEDVTGCVVQTRKITLSELEKALAGDPVPGDIKFLAQAHEIDDYSREFRNCVDLTRSAYPTELLTVDQVIEKWSLLERCS